MSAIKKTLFYTLLFYTIFGFFILPFLVKSQLVKIIDQQTNAKASLESVYFNPFVFKMELDGFSLKDLNGTHLVGFESFCFNFEPHSLLTGTIHLKRIALQKPVVSVVLYKDKSLNLLSILKDTNNTQQKDKNTTASPLPHIVLDELKIRDGVVKYHDFTHKSAFDFTLESIGFSIEHFDTHDTKSNDGSVRLYATLGDGGFIDLQTTLDRFEPLTLHGSLDFEASKLYTQWRYVKDMLKLEVADGKISLHSEFAFAIDDINNTTMTNTQVVLQNLRIKPKNKEHDILHLKKLELQSSLLRPLQQQGRVEHIVLDTLEVEAIRKRDGKIDWSEYTQTNTQLPEEKSNDTNTTTAAPWDIDIKSIELHNIAASFNDKAITPAVVSSVEKLHILIENVNTLGKTPFSYFVQTSLNQHATCEIDGTLKWNTLDIFTKTKCDDFDIVHYKPYINKAAKENLAVFDIDLQKAYTNISLKTHLYENNGSVIAMVEDANVSLDKLKVAKNSTHTPLLNMKSFQIHNARVDTVKKDVDIEKVIVKQLALYLERYKNNKLNVDGIVVAKKQPQKKVSQKETDSQPYHITLKEFRLKDAKVLFKDRALPKVQKHSLDRVYITLKNIDSNKGTWLSYKTYMRINKGAKLYTQGKLRHTPLKEMGSFDLKNLDLRVLTPYLQESTYIAIDDGRISMKGQTQYAPSKKYPDLRVTGDFTIDSLFINNTQDNSFLFSMNKFYIQSYTLELMPNRLYVDEVDIDSFYVNAKIDENKVLNFSTLVKKTTTENNNTQEDTLQKKKEQPAFPVTIVKVNVKNGSAKFSDFSIPIKFQTDIHDLNGVMYALSNTPNETTYLKIAGEVDKYGSTLLQGSLDSGDPKKYTDIDFNFKNLELSSLSGYSAEFAGYKIDSGKLYLDLGYDIENSQLHGSNSIIIKKIKLGDEIEDENVTHLPLGFVIGLLEDSDGIIDIDMPVEGDLNQPDFKYGALVLKTLGNLIAKAVTSPFKFLGSMLGMDGEDLEFVAFEAGSIHITPPQREKLDTLAKMMVKRPKLELRVIGGYDQDKDTLALQKAKLIAQVIQKSGDKNIKESESAITVEMLELIYTQAKGEESLKKLQTKLQAEYKDSEDDLKRAYQKRLVDACIELQKITKEELETLAYKRAEAIVTYLREEKHIAAHRLKAAKESRVSDEDDGVMTKLEINVADVK